MKHAVVIIAALALACGNKKAPAGSPDAAAAAAGGAAAGGDTAATKTPPAGETRTAEGGAVSGLKVVTECPKSLAGSEEVARVIKKECGPIPVTGDYAVDGTLTLEAGVVLKMSDGVEIDVGYNKASKLIVKGTAADPVTLTTAGDQVAGVWKGLRLRGNANRSVIEGLVIDFGGDDRGALFIGASDVTVKGSTIRNAKEVGLRVENDATLAELSGNTFEKAGALAMSVPPSAVGGLGAGNKLDAGAVIEVRGGHIEQNAKWQNAGAPYQIAEEIMIDGKNVRATVEIAAGTELRFAPDARLAVGYNAPAALIVAGTADKPVLFTGAGEKSPGAWRGLDVRGNGEATIAGAIFENGGKDDDAGVLFVTDGGTLSLKGSTLRNNVTGLVLQNGAKVKGLDGNTFSGNKLAAVVYAQHVGAFAAGNKLEKERVDIRAGEVKESATWNALGAAVEIAETINVQGRATLTLAPGLDLAFRSGAGLNVGYGEIGGLKAVGTADKPIHLHGVSADPGSWEGVTLYDNARDVVLDYVALEGTGGEGGVRVRDDATAKVDHLVCKKCAEAALFRACRAKVEVGEVKGEDGTPVGDKKPEGC